MPGRDILIDVKIKALLLYLAFLEIQMHATMGETRRVDSRPHR